MKSTSKNSLDITNSFAWFFMDAFWMTESLTLSYLCIAPTVITGFLLIFKEDNTSSYLVAISAFLWAAMNSLWLLGDTLSLINYLVFCKVMFMGGILCMAVAILISNDVSKTLLSFRRFKLRGKI